MLNELSVYSNNIWVVAIYIYLIGLLITLIIAFASAMTLNYEPKGCSGFAVAFVLVPFMIAWPLFWIIVIVYQLFIARRNQ